MPYPREQVVKPQLCWWWLLRLLPPLAIAGLILLLRSGRDSMDSFVAAAWIGFAFHVVGWRFNRHYRATDAMGFVPLLFFYGRIADIAWHRRRFNSDDVVVVLASFGAYIGLTLLAWASRPESDRVQE